jgi:hypothetical protein
MSISSQLLILNQTKTNIKESINLKGVTVTDEAFADYPDKVRLIPNGGGIYESQIALYLEGKLTNAEIPYGTTRIGNYALGYMYSLTSVTIPDTVTSIGNHSFEGCRVLANITIPDSVTSIGNNAFAAIGSLSSVTIGSGVTSIGDYAFSTCENLSEVIINAATPPTLGESVFNNTHQSLVIYVPDESVLAYQIANGWSSLSSRIKGISEKP